MKKVDWNNYEVGNGWLLEDFIFNKEKKTIRSFSFSGLNKLKENKVVVIPGIIPDPEIDEKRRLPKVEIIEPFAFAELEMLEIFLPYSLKEIGERAFENCKISKINFDEGLEIIGASAFKNNRVGEVNLPDSLIKIGDGAFSSNSIFNLTIGDNMLEIGERAFVGNPIKNLKLGKNLKKIGMRAFPETNAVEKALFNYAVSN